ncbi:hypothetical protein Taro_008519 [Colocasia esculenta]|uniref:Uncharacterized protein n=1 Tax=Colocasia esculenta TaxID=4460 RepID=A0A843U768_COLES|nr:hypothetical protein [Colocasia esculenta]
MEGRRVEHLDKTVELSFFGRLKKEKLESHNPPLREATTPTCLQHLLGHSQLGQPGSQRGQPTTLHRQRGSDDVCEASGGSHSHRECGEWSVDNGKDKTKGQGTSILSEVGVCRFCHGGVDTPSTGVDTMLQALRQKMKKWSSGVDTGSSSVDTSPSSQRTQLTGLYCVSTQPQVVSTLDPVPRRPVWQFWTGGINTHVLGTPNDPTREQAKTILEKGDLSGKEASASRGAKQRRQRENQEKKKEKKRRSSRLQEC